MCLCVVGSLASTCKLSGARDQPKLRLTTGNANLRVLPLPPPPLQAALPLGGRAEAGAGVGSLVAQLAQRPARARQARASSAPRTTCAPLDPISVGRRSQK